MSLSQTTAWLAATRSAVFSRLNFAVVLLSRSGVLEASECLLDDMLPLVLVSDPAMERVHVERVTRLNHAPDTPAVRACAVQSRGLHLFVCVRLSLASTNMILRVVIASAAAGSACNIIKHYQKLDKIICFRITLSSYYVGPHVSCWPGSSAH